MNLRALLFLSLLLPCGALMAADNQPVTPVDLNRYAGTWYEIARLPMFFQRKCARDVTATYTLKDGYVAVLNRCVKADGKAITAEGKAFVVDAPLNRHLEVGFFEILGWMPFKGDYLILDIDPQYQWVIVGHPQRKYGWILSRTQTIPAPLRADLDQRLQKLGYDPRAFIASPPSVR